MKKMLKYSLPISLSILFGFALFFQACEKSLDSGDPGGGGGGGGGATVSTNLSIHVMNEGQNALSGVTITAYDVSAITDGSGNASLSNVAIPIADAGRMRIVLEKDGFFAKHMGFTPIINGETSTNTVLVEKELAGSFDNSTGGSASTQDQKANVDVAPNSYATKDGGTYSGETKVYMKYVDPGKEDFVLAMPGGSDLWAKNELGEEGILESLGAVYMKTETATGEELVPSPLAKFDFCLGIPVDLQEAAPDQIQVWYISSSGDWAAFGIAQKIGSQYCFTSDREGSINCDIFGRSAILEGSVCDENGLAAGDVMVKAGQAITYTDKQGEFSMLVPSNKSFVVKGPNCTKVMENIDAGSIQSITMGCVDGDCGSGSRFDFNIDGVQHISLGGGFIKFDDMLYIENNAFTTLGKHLSVNIQWATPKYDDVFVGHYDFAGTNDHVVWLSMYNGENQKHYSATYFGGGTIDITELEKDFRIKGFFTDVYMLEHNGGDNPESFILNGTFESYYGLSK